MDENQLSEFLTDEELIETKERISKMTPEEMSAFALGVRLASVFINPDEREQIEALSACLVALGDCLSEA